MRIDYVTNLRVPSTKANSIQVMHNCEAMKKANVRVHLTVPKRFGTKKEEKIEDIWEYYQIGKEFPVKKLFCVDLFPLGFERLAFIVQSVSFYVWVGLRFLFRKTDVIYTRDIWIALALFYKRKKVIELHNYPSSGLGQFVYRVLLKFFWKVVVISEGLEKEVPGAFVAPDGVKLELFDTGEGRTRTREKLKMPPSAEIVVYTGSLQKWKGIEVLLKAMKKLSGVYLYVVGSSLDKKDLEDLPKADNVTFVGHVPYNEVHLYLKAADALVIPNTGGDKISKKYTSPLKAFEYMAADRPIVVSDLPSMREIFDKKNSYLFKSGDSDDLVRALKEALADEGERRGDASKYSWEVRMEGILGFIKG